MRVCYPRTPKLRRMEHRSDEQGSVLAWTSGKDEHPGVRTAAIDHGREHGCTLILYAADAPSAIADPAPNRWGSEGEGRDLGDRLTVDDLEYLGQPAIATQVREAQAGGVTAFGWLPSDHGPQPLVEYAGDQGAHLIFIPDGFDWTDDLAARLGGDSTATGAPQAPGIRVERVGDRAA